MGHCGSEGPLQDEDYSWELKRKNSKCLVWSPPPTKGNFVYGLGGIYNKLKITSSTINSAVGGLSARVFTTAVVRFCHHLIVLLYSVHAKGHLVLAAVGCLHIFVCSDFRPFPHYFSNVLNGRNKTVTFCSWPVFIMCRLFFPLSLFHQ